MQPVSAIAIYFLFWFFSLFLVLPFGVKTDHEMGVESEPGHAESAPHRFHFGRVVLRTTILGAIFFGLFYANYRYGWVGVDFLDFLKPEGMEAAPNVASR
jgi:predicted secreted protein